MFQVSYEYYDKRGYRRTKTFLCVNVEKTKEKCLEIMTQKEPEPICNPSVYLVENGIPSQMVLLDDILKG